MITGLSFKHPIFTSMVIYAMWGGVTATNVKIHVVAYQSGGVVAINTDIVLGSIADES
jgi:hypothetical protein